MTTPSTTPVFVRIQHSNRDGSRLYSTIPVQISPGDRILADCPGVGLRWGWCILIDAGNGLVALNLGFGRIVWVGLGDVLESEPG